MINFIKELEHRIINNEYITKEEAIKLGSIIKSNELEALYESADNIRKFFCGNKVDLCSIMNAKSGNCSEDCKFCAQSAYYKTKIKIYALVNDESAIKLAMENEKEGVNRFSLVTSGRGITTKELNKVISIYKNINKKTNLNLCASLGILKYDDLLRLKNSGVKMYHHNLETSNNYYNKICTTHSYEERINTILEAKKVGMNICSGGIIGLGENLKDRIDLAFQLRELEVCSIPINVLTPIKGTPFENNKPLTQNEILKTIAICRFINPKAFIRLGGGRALIDNFGEKCFKVGANATITGNYLTTCGNNIWDDKKMIKRLGLEVSKNE